MHRMEDTKIYKILVLYVSGTRRSRTIWPSLTWPNSRPTMRSIRNTSTTPNPSAKSKKNSKFDSAHFSGLLRNAGMACCWINW